MLFRTSQMCSTISAVEFSELLKKNQQELWSGMAQVEWATNEQRLLLIVRGELMGVYKNVASGYQKVDTIDELALLSKADLMQVATLPLSIASLRLCKLYFENLAPAETISIQMERLPVLMNQWGKLPVPNLIVLRWKEAEGLLLFYANDPSPEHAFLLSKAGPLHGADAIAKARTWGEPTASILKYPYADNALAWEEFNLYLAFNAFLSGMLSHYKELTGLALLNALGRNINRVAMEEKCDLSLTLGNLTDNSMFANSRETIDTYNTILAVVFEHVAIVLGQKLMQHTAQETIASMKPLYAKLMWKFDAVMHFGILSSDKSRERAYA